MSDSHKWAETIMQEYLGAIDNWPAGMCNYLDLALQQTERAAYETAAQLVEKQADNHYASGRVLEWEALKDAARQVRYFHDDQSALDTQQGEDGG